MPKMLSDGNTKLVYVPSLDDFHAPTIAELTGTDALELSDKVPVTNFTFGATGEDTISDPPLCAVGNDSAPGRVTYEAAMDFWRYTTAAEDKAWTTFADKGQAGYLVMRIGTPWETPFAANQEVFVMGVLNGTRQPLPPAGGYTKFRSVFYPQSSQVDDAAKVAAS